MAVILNVEHLRKHFTDEPVLVDVTFQVRTGDKIGLVGPNGCGKTTLLNILANREESEKGKIEKPGDVNIGYLEQRPEIIPGRTVIEEAKLALSHLLELQVEAEEIAHKLAEITDPVEHNRMAARYDRIHEDLMRHDAYQLDYRIERILHGLGFFDEDMQKETSSLSGGELNRLSLAKLLLAEPEIMLLDEPSNHLDLLATEWLEEFLRTTSAAVILVSHDRYFLDRVTNRTFELLFGTVDDYQGNFTAYSRQKDERLLVQVRTYEKYVEEVEKAKDFIRRNHYGMKATQAEDRRKKLDRLLEEPAALPRKIECPPMLFPEPSRTGDIVFRCEHLSKGFTPEKPLFRDLSFDINRGQRWAILGPNGCGKTTFLRCLLGEIEPDSGAVRFGQGVKVGYFDQQLHVLDNEIRVVDAIRPEKRVFEEPARRSLLGAFGITGDAQLQTVKSLSGGQRCRAALARLSAEESNVLILDEPTNHLDLWARKALENAIRKFEGTVIFISHDRYFVDQLADHLLIIQPDARFKTIEGNYTEFRRMVARGVIVDPFLSNPGADRKSVLGKSAVPGRDAEKKQAKQQGQQSGNSQSKQQGRKAGKKHTENKAGIVPESNPGTTVKPKKKPGAANANSSHAKSPDLAQGQKKHVPKIKEADGKKQRKFPYRKLSDIEEEVFARETRIMSLNEEVLLPQVLRDGERLKSIQTEIAEEQAKLKQLYEHWEESSELNW